MANDKDDKDNNNESWPWNEPMIQSLKAEHDRLTSQLRDSNAELDKSSGNGHNPFSAFKEFVDSNVNSLYNSVASIPSNIAEMRENMRREQERKRERTQQWLQGMKEQEQDISCRWTGSKDTPDHIRMELSRSSEEEKEDAYTATMRLLNEAQRKNAHVPQDKIRALFGNEMEGLDFFPANPWLTVDWFKRNPYSPIRLEADSDLQESGKNSRAAFEDLMDASLDKPMSSREFVGVREPHGKPQSTYHGPGLEWLLSLQCRGVLPPLLPRFYNEGVRVWGHSDSPVLTELTIPKNLPLGEHVFGAFGRPPLERDFIDLMSEVGIKSTSDTEAEPLMESTTEDLKKYQRQLQVFWEQNQARLRAARDEQLSAETEQDLYDSVHAMSQSSAKRKEQLDEEMEQLDRQDDDEEDDDEAYQWANLKEMVGEKRQAPATEMPRKPDVLSALTTTRTTRLPDGTVTTEVVLRKRFSDGTETTEESVHTSNEALERRHQEQREGEEKPRKKGWFWT